MGGNVPEPVPVEETRGGEEAGDWKVSPEAQIKAALEYMEREYGEETGPE